METANHTTMHVTETKTLCSSLTCPQSKSEEITKYQEEELLCGNSEDGDEEDALSDDSMRLRLSDDEAELDEPATSEDVIIKKANHEDANMELGSDVSATDTSEQINASRVQMPANGICTVESENLYDNQEDQVSNDDFTEDLIPSADNFIHSSDSSKPCNGVSSQIGTTPIEELSITEMQNNKWKISGQFGKYSNRANRISQSRKPYSESNKYATDPYNNKYYNKNTYYGGGKGSGRAYISYIRESLNCDETAVKRDAMSVPSPSTETTESEAAQVPGGPCLPIKSEFSTVKSLDSENGFLNNVESESSEPNKTEDSVDNSEDANGLTDDVDDNLKAASVSVDNLVPEKESDQPDRSQESLRADSVVDHEAVVNTEFENPNTSISSASTLVLDDLNSSVAERLSEDMEDSGEAEQQSKSSKDLKVELDLNLKEANLHSDEADLTSKDVDLHPEEADLNSREADLNLGEADFNLENADLNSKGADGDIEKIAENDASEETDERTKEERSSEVPEGENTVVQEEEEEEEEVVVEEIETISTEADESNETYFLNKDKDELAGESEKCDDPKEVDNKIPEENESTKLESQNSGSPVEGMEKSQDEIVSATPEKQSNIAVSEQALKEPSIVMTNDCETVGSTAVSTDKEIPSDPTILDVEDHIADLPDEKETSSEDESEACNVRIQYTTLKRTSTESLDEMELFKRMRIQRRQSEFYAPGEKHIPADVASSVQSDAINKTNNSASTVVNPVTNSIADSKSSSESEASLISNNVVENLIDELVGQPKDVKSDSSNTKKYTIKVDDCEVVEVPTKKKQKRSRKSLQTVRDTVVNQEDTQEKENVRQKRRTAKNAEEIIRKEFLGNSDSESNDSTGNLVAVNYKGSNNLRAASPPSLKRSYIEEDEKPEKSTIKKLKQDLSSSEDVPTNKSTLAMTKTQTLAHVRNFFRRDANGKLAKLKQEELEELLIQKVVETITMRDEIGKLREQAKISERNQEATRLKCQQLAKQIKDFEMVLNRYQSDRRSNPDKTVVPIKINRSVGLQVNFVTQEHGIQNLRQLAQTQKNAPPVANGMSSPQQSEQPPSTVPMAKRTVKVRSPRRPDPPAPVPTVTTVSTPVHTQPIISNITPAALVVTKNVTDSRTPVTPTVHHTTAPHPIAPKQTILVNGPITSQPIRQATAIQVSRTTTNSDLIDLTQEEDKTKTTVVPQNTILATTITEPPTSIPNVQKIAPRYHTVIQTLPGSVAITAQPGIRVVQPSSQPTPTALVNNMNAPRLAYVMQGGMGSARQVVVTSAPAPIRPTPAIRTSYPLSGTITNGTVRVIPMTSTATIQVYKHPAALPESLNSPSNPAWKLPPPAPSLKISKVTNGIVLSWNMALSEKYADIASYQLYAYQEVSGIAPSSTLWKKVGDVRALPLPMACTLTQFSEGNNYYFAVRAVDKHSRLGLYSQPGNISL